MPLEKAMAVHTALPLADFLFPGHRVGVVSVREAGLGSLAAGSAGYLGRLDNE